MHWHGLQITIEFKEQPVNENRDITPEKFQTAAHEATKAPEGRTAAVRGLPFDSRRFASDRAYRAEYRAEVKRQKEEARARMSPEERQAAEERERQRELKRPCPYCGERGERELSR